jgi:hypothetical protein
VTFDPLTSSDFLSNVVTLTGTVVAATDDPFDVRFQITNPSGEVRQFQPEIDQKAGTWKVQLSLFPGGNAVEAIVANRWRGGRTVDGTLGLRYRRPPRVTVFPKEVEAVETNRVELALTVEGPSERPLKAIKVDQQPVRFDPGEPALQGDRWVWQVKLPEVFVNDGERNLDQVSVKAVTDEGASEAAIVRVIHRQIPRPPRTAFLNPRIADTSQRPEYTVTFRGESERPLEKVEIRRDGELLYRSDLKRVEREGPLHVLQEEAGLTLKNGVNNLELVAVNADGRSPRTGVVVSFTEPAVIINIDRVELLTDTGDVRQVLTPAYNPSGALTFPKAPQSLVWLTGRVRWSDPHAKALDDLDLEVSVRVGDCRQFPVALGPHGRGDDAKVRPFRVPLVLIGAVNRIKVEVPTVGQHELSRREFELACAAPAQNQRLHVLVVGVDVKDAVGLKKRVLDALAVEPQDRPAGAQGEFFKKPPFERCVLYHVLAGEVDRGKVEAQLVEINKEIARLKLATGWLNDVVLIYYQGEDVEVPEKKERWLKTSRNLQFPKARPQEFAIPCHDLPRVPGAQLLLLNVADAPKALTAGQDWGGNPDTGFMRYAFNDPREIRSANPALLNLLQEAIKKNGRLGDVAKYMNDLLNRRPQTFNPLVILDEDQASRRLSGPDR